MKPQRIWALDGLRGLAVVAMATYHFSWDLAWFGHVDWNVSHDPKWRAFAASIAGTFLLVSGISLALAHGNTIRWRSFWKREVVIAVAALAVSAATYFAFADNFVRFGILHSIAVCSLIALPFTRTPALVSLCAAAFAASLPLWATSHLFDGQPLLWTGLGQPTYGSVDYVPLAPWVAAPLLGVAIGKLIARHQDRVAHLNRFLEGLPGRIMRFLGRHSLAIYLLHQPVLYGLVWAVTASGMTPDRSVTIFVRDCTNSCATTFGDQEACRTSCSCTVKTLQDQGLWTKLTGHPQDPDLRLSLNQTYAECLREIPAPDGSDTIPQNSQ